MRQVNVDHSKPRFTVGAARRLAEDLFGVHGTISCLPSERDQNFCICGPTESWVLKVSASGEDRKVLEFQHEMIGRIAHASPDLAVPQIFKSKLDRTIEIMAGDTGQSHLIRLFSYLPGRPLVEVKPHSSALLLDIGRHLGRMGNALFDFDHPSAHRDLNWDLRFAGQLVRENGNTIEDQVLRDELLQFAEQFETVLVPQCTGLRTSVIHNDANDFNLLIDDAPGKQRLCGIIDFGDALHSWTIAELAIVCTYLMLGKRDPLAAAADVVRGFHGALPIEESELEVLFDLIHARVCASLCLASARAASRSDNNYLFVSARPLLELHRQLADIHPRFALETFRSACEFPASTAHLVQWLSGHAGQFARVTDVDFDGEPWSLTDLGVGSPLTSDLEQLSTTAEREELVFERVHQDGARVGIGRYGEPRGWYRSHQFLESSTGSPRTIHLGIDIFLPAGSPVVCPLAARVHSFGDNTLDLDYGPTVILEHEWDHGKFYTLYGHLSREALGGLTIGRKIAAGESFATLGDSSVNGGWVPHLHFQIVSHMLGNHGDFPGVAPADAAAVWMNLCPDPNLILRIPNLRAVSDLPLQLRTERLAVTGRALSLSYNEPLHIAKGRAQYLYAWNGIEYLDCVNNVAHVGHSHPHVVRAIAQQAAVLNTNTRYLCEQFNRYVQTLLSHFPQPLSVCFLTCSGSEANELALRIAKCFTHGSDVIVLDHAYHGNTEQLVGLSPYKFNGPGGRGPGPHTHVVPLPSASDPRYLSDPTKYVDTHVKIAQKVAESITQQERKLAALLIESISGCGGQVIIPDGYMSRAFEAARAQGGVCIADEVQTGFGRVGTHFWAYETHDVVPDLVTMGKPIGNGHPMGAVVTRREIADAFADGMEYFNTFGGNPVACAAGLAVLEVIEQEQLQNQALEVGQYLLEQLRQLQTNHPIIVDVRGRGLFIGVEFTAPNDWQSSAVAGHVVERMKQHRILLSTDGPLNNVIKIKPPLCFGRGDADRLCEALSEVLDDSCLRDLSGRSVESRAAATDKV